MKQHEAVICAMEENGGFATLGHLYQSVLRVPGCKWGTKTPFASIRRIVQEKPEFFRIKPGLWGLAADRKRILENLGISPQAAATEAEEFDHTYYQGLLAEIGGLKGFETFVPRQDRNKPFLNRKLGDMATLAEYHSFTYEDIVRRARTVDVTWFNKRKMPSSLFEVEHTTDFQNSLLKFLEFQDFRIQLWIIAESVRRGEFQTKIAYTAFGPIRGDVRFLDYQTLSDWHTKVSAAVAVERALQMSGGT